MNLRVPLLIGFIVGAAMIAPLWVRVIMDEHDFKTTNAKNQRTVRDTIECVGGLTGVVETLVAERHTGAKTK